MTTPKTDDAARSAACSPKCITAWCTPDDPCEDCIKEASEEVASAPKPYRLASQRLAEYFEKAREQKFPVYAEELEEIIAENTVPDHAWRGAFEHLAKMLGVERPNMGHCSAATFDVMQAIQLLKGSPTHDLITQLIADGGAIVSSDACSPLEIGVAQSVGRFAVDSDGMGFVRRPREWLAINKRREELHPNTDGRYSENAELSDSRKETHDGK